MLAALSIAAILLSILLGVLVGRRRRARHPPTI
jgi:type II secretory pathway pseudopilin PulG